MKDGPAVIRIDPDGRYAFLIHGFVAGEEVTLLQERLASWWQSGEKFMVVAIASGLEVKLKRVDKE